MRRGVANTTDAAEVVSLERYFSRSERKDWNVPAPASDQRLRLEKKTTYRSVAQWIPAPS